MKRTYSRLISILLTAVLIMSSAALAFADDETVGAQQSGTEAAGAESGGSGQSGDTGDGNGGAGENGSGDAGGQTDQPGGSGDTGGTTDPGTGGEGGQDPGPGTGGQEDPDDPACAEHSVSEWTVVTEATCIDAGSREGVCDNCGEKVTEEVPATGVHQFSAWKTVRAATYIANGSAERTCSVCGKKETKVLARRKAYNKWVTVSGKKYYLNSAGNVVKGWQKIRISNKKKAKVKWCWFNSSGVFRKSVKKNTKNKWVSADGKKFWFTSSKKPIGPGFHFIKGKLYYMLSDKSMAKGTFKASDGKTYTTTSGGYITGIEYYRHKYKSFILIDISEQRLSYYSGGKVRLKADVVTGRKGKHDTPTGTFRIRGKSRNTTLTGPTWNSKVSYWMAFIGSSYGMHDAPWRSSSQFSNHKTYVRNGSHGCVNMRYKDAKYLYENAGKGTPVIVQK